MRAVVHIPPDQRAVRLGMQMPRHGVCRRFYIFIHDLLTITNQVVLGDQRVLFRIYTGRNTLQSSTLSTVSQGSQTNYALEAAKVLGDGAFNLSKHDVVSETEDSGQKIQVPSSSQRERPASTPFRLIMS
jgi:hypothetical protein